MLLDIADWKNEKITGSDNFAEISRRILAGFDRLERQKEHFFAIGLDTKNFIQYIDCVSTGTLDASLVHPRETFRQAIAYGVSSIILMHNHPSGDATPSREDKAVTERLSSVGKTLGIDVLDHMIIGSSTDLAGESYSLREHESYLFERSSPSSLHDECLREDAMANSHDELEAFKRLPINFAAASFGYRIDKKKSSKHSAVMVGKDGHKIVCSTARHDGHGVFFSTSDNVSGSIIDLVSHHLGGANLGVVRKALRPLLETGGLPDHVDDAGWKLEPTTTDFLGVLARFSNFEAITAPHPFLSDTRQIADSVLLNDRFKGRIFNDPSKGTAIFPHWGSPDGSSDRCLTGYTIKHDGLTMFSKGGKKGLWPSNATANDNQLVICEAAIDCLSYACVKAKIDLTRYIATGGQLNPEQPALIQSAIAKLPAGSEVTIAVDHDDAGDQLTQTLSKIFNAAKRDDLRLTIDRPETRGFDWNRHLTQG